MNSTPPQCHAGRTLASLYMNEFDWQSVHLRDGTGRMHQEVGYKITGQCEKG